MCFRRADILTAMSEPRDPASAPPDGPAADGRHAPSWLGSRLRWFLAEFLVVVVGVLVALGLSGLVEEQRELQREQVYLQQLSADLGSSDKELSTAVEFMQTRAEAAARVLHRFWRKDPVLDDAFFVDLSQPRGTRRFRPVLGTAEALGSSGEMGLIRSDALRADLLAYVERMKTRLAEIDRYDETYYRPGVALLSSGPLWRSPANSSLVQGTDDKLRPRPNQYDRIPFPNEPADQLASREVYVGYSNLLTAHRNHAEQYKEMLLETRALRTKVDAHIRTKGQGGRGG